MADEEFPSLRWRPTCSDYFRLATTPVEHRCRFHIQSIPLTVLFVRSPVFQFAHTSLSMASRAFLRRVSSPRAPVRSFSQLRSSKRRLRPQVAVTAQGLVKATNEIIWPASSLFLQRFVCSETGAMRSH